MTGNQKTIAVFFGGRSPEHDVSVVTGLQAIQALDPTLYKPFPVYVTTEGRWLTGDILLNRDSYMPDAYVLERTTEVTLDVLPKGQPALIPRRRGLFAGAKPAGFDVAVPAFHGLYGEDGQIQGLFELAGVPYAGPRTMSAAVFMDKEATKHVCRSLGIPVLPCTILRRPLQGYLISEEQIAESLAGMSWPVIVKPCHLGSSIGVAKVSNPAELAASLPAIFRYDTSAVVEPCVPNLVEYNVSVSRAFGGLATSAIERPKSTQELLDFKQKYLSGGGTKGGVKGGGTKTPGETSQGMLSLTRELNPPLSPEAEKNIRFWSENLFLALDGSGAPRIDFLCNARTGEIWLNEFNPLPGSFAYFLWEAAARPVLFTQLLTSLIEEALERKDQTYLPPDPVPVDARLFQRR